MKQRKKEAEHLEGYRANIEECKELYQEQKKASIKNIIFMLAALIAILLLTVAWFINNSKVTGGGIQVSSENISFELKSYGKSGIYDSDIIGKFFKTIATATESSSASYTTSPTTPSITWLVSDESNIGNYNSKEIQFSSTEEERKDYAIEPGSGGKFTFYLIPKTSGTQTFSFQLSVIPYLAAVNVDSNEITSVTEIGLENDTAIKKYAKQFISGHILFFLEPENKTESTDQSENITDQSEEIKTSETATESSWIQDGTFSITIENAEAEKEYAYTIQWKWPQVFSEIILNQGDTYLDGRTPILTDSLREQILTDMSTDPQKYFYNSLSKSPLQAENELIAGGKLLAIHDKSPKVGGTDGYNAQNFVDLSSFYNQADQIIGSQISFILLELTAEIGGEAE